MINPEIRIEVTGAGDINLVIRNNGQIVMHHDIREEFNKANESLKEMEKSLTVESLSQSFETVANTKPDYSKLTPTESWLIKRRLES